jgi:anaerobic selenocysteine-containing dehydrogenase
MGERKQIRTFCGVCAISCAIVAEVEDGKLLSIKADAKSEFRHSICPRGKGPLTIVGTENHPDRLKYPLRRVGERGSGKWERISWDEALDFIAEKLQNIKEKFGPERVAVLLGEPKSMETIFGHKFATVFGTPNVFTPGGLCGVPRQEAFYYTFGKSVLADWPIDVAKPGSPMPRLFIAWGADLRRYLGRHMLKMARRSNAKVVVIDPVKSWVVKHFAQMWIRPRPGSDGALSMGVLKVIIEEDLYDKDFVDRWTIGFDNIREEVKKFTLDDVEKITWVAKSQIQELARLYATTKPASIQEGNSLEFFANTFSTFRTTSILRAVTGNVNRPGSDVFVTRSEHARPGTLMMLGKLGRDTNKMLAKDLSAARRWSYTPYQYLPKANLEGKPYTIKAVICCLTNPVVSYADSQATYEALMKTELNVVMELFHTPTTAIADIVLPAAWTNEVDTIGYWGGRKEEYRAYSKIVDPPGEAWPDDKIFNELSKKLRLPHTYDDPEEALSELLEGSGLTFDEFLKKRKMLPAKQYKSFDEEPPATPSHKIEIYSERLKKQGLDPIPTWKELTNFPQTTAEYPLVLTSFKENSFMLTGFKMIDSLRRLTPVPRVRVNPQTADKLGMKDGDWIFIETKKGKITQKLVIDPDTDPRVINAAWGWWFPEDGAETGYGWKKSNFNMLTGYEQIAPPVGTPQLKGIPCRICKA